MIPNEILLLKIIAFNGSVSLLQERGLSYSQIALMMRDLKKKGYIENKEASLYLTVLGYDKINNYDQNEINRETKWIVRQEHLFHEPLPFNTIILPRKRDLL